MYICICIYIYTYIIYVYIYIITTYMKAPAKAFNIITAVQTLSRELKTGELRSALLNRMAGVVPIADLPVGLQTAIKRLAPELVQTAPAKAPASEPVVAIENGPASEPVAALENGPSPAIAPASEPVAAVENGPASAEPVAANGPSPAIANGGVEAQP